MALGALTTLTIPTFGVESKDVKHSQNEPLEKVDKLDSVIVSATRAGKRTPVTYTMVGKKALRSTNPINSLPMSLSLQPSVVSTTEGGTGLGYSKLSVRGCSGSQINVTLNGITLNDSESQEVFWVNIPALTGILSSVQLQRGLGTTANGAGAFGASINMNTSSVGALPFAHVDVARGSYGTMSTLVSAGSGLMPSGFFVNAAYSRGYTDGYIRNAKAEVQSAFVNAGWMDEHNSIKLTYLMGGQHSGITWNGLSQSKYEAGDYKYNSAGEYTDQYGNVHYYDNDTDNYKQHHIQLNYTHAFNDALHWSTTVNYTKGDGYYQNYKANKKFKKYGLQNAKPMNDAGLPMQKKGDFIVKKSMDNYYLVVNSSLVYKTDILNLSSGLYLSRYDGDHFGKVLWNNILGDKFDYSNTEWYRNNGLKQEANAFIRAEYNPIENLTTYVDLQYRGIKLEMTGADDNFESVAYKKTWNFFNPRVGATYVFNNHHQIYASAALGHREPGRGDLKDNIESMHNAIANGDKDAKVTLKPEKMLDFEFGYEFTIPSFKASANVYMMEYKDMLLETGRLSNVGYAVKDNVPDAFRRGIELAAAWKPFDEVLINANAAFSTNKIKDYTFGVVEYDNSSNWNPVGVKEEYCGKTDMLLSPSVIASGEVAYTPFKNIASNSFKTTTLAFNGRYVGSQYWDNTSCNDRKVPSYFVAGLSLKHVFNIRKGSCLNSNDSGKLGIGVYVDNIFDNRYYAYAWVWRGHFRDENTYTQDEGLYPQAPTNVMFKVTYDF